MCSPTALILIGFCGLSYLIPTPTRAADDDLPAETKALVARLKEDLKSKTPSTRAGAYTAMGELGTKARSLRRTLCEGMMDKAPVAKTAAADALKKVDDEIYRMATALLINRDFKQMPLAQKMNSGAEPVAPIILKLAESLSPTASLSTVGVDVGTRVKIEQSRDELVSCVGTLALIAPEDEQVNKAIIKMLANPIPELRATALSQVPAIKNRKLALTGVLLIAGSQANTPLVRAQAIRLAPVLVDVNTTPNARKVIESLRFDQAEMVRNAVSEVMEKLK
ncbi:MAG: repeat protein [Gemmataceae bacterium]|nr:repeat protein [Gemmataceae bacterium]